MIPPLPESFLRAPIAHRGLHDVTDGRPENSLAAARAAIAHGYGIELDIQMSADGVPMVFHDYSLERLAEAEGPIRSRTAAELGRIRLKGGDEGIPTFREFLDVVDTRVPLLIEIKDQDGALGDDVGPLEQAVCTALIGYWGDVALMSFNPYSVAAMQALAPGLARGLVTEDFRGGDWPVPEARLAEVRAIPDYARVGASFISHDWHDLGSPRVAELKAAGARILCWTVKSEADEAEARKVAENITFERYLARMPATA